MFGRKSLTLYEGMTGLLEIDFINIKGVSFEILAGVESDDTPANGVIVSQGGRFGGWSLYVKDGTPIFTYNYLGIDMYTTKATTTLPKGKATMKLDFKYAGGNSLVLVVPQLSTLMTSRLAQTRLKRLNSQSFPRMRLPAWKWIWKRLSQRTTTLQAANLRRRSTK